VPELLHPNGNAVALRPWGSRKLAMLDKTAMCVNLPEGRAKSGGFVIGSAQFGAWGPSKRLEQ